MGDRQFTARGQPRRCTQVGDQLAEIGVRPSRSCGPGGRIEIGITAVIAPGRAPLQRVHADRSLHQVVIGRVGGRLGSR